MPETQPDLPGLSEPFEALQTAVDELRGGGAPPAILVQGPQAAGRRALLRRIEEHCAQNNVPALFLEALQFGHDTPAHLLLQVAALLPESPQAKTVTDFASPWPEKVAAAGKILSSCAARVIMLRFPAGWPRGDDRADRQVKQETWDVIAVLTKPQAGKLHIIAGQSTWKWRHDAPHQIVEVRASSQSKKFLADAGYWGDLAPAAQSLLKVLGSGADHLSPLQLRLGVALLASGTPAPVLRKALAPKSTLRDLEFSLRRMLAGRPALATALSRVARARTAVDEKVVEDVAAAGEEWNLLSRCFLYPDSQARLRFHDQLRFLIDEATPQTQSHEKLRAYYQSQDGATTVSQGLKKVVPWLEKIHHASRGDQSGDVDAWLTLNPPSREHYWEFGWSLSYVYRRYEQAARVFRELLNRVPGEQDNYGLHYYAYNLDRAGREPLTAERYYRRAVEGDAANPWWNGRYISFLTARGRFEPALTAWNAALEAIDPDGGRSGGDWLPFNFHKHVIKAALESGDLELADAAQRSVRAPASDEEVFRMLAEEIAAAREVRRLGEALFPADVPVQKWWIPRLLVPRPGETFSNWRAGRVLSVTPEEIRVVLGQRCKEEKGQVEYQVLSAATWNETAIEPPHAGDFIETAEIDGKFRLIAEEPQGSAADPVELMKALRFLNRPPA